MVPRKTKRLRGFELEPKKFYRFIDQKMRINSQWKITIFPKDYLEDLDYSKAIGEVTAGKFFYLVAKDRVYIQRNGRMEHKEEDSYQIICDDTIGWIVISPKTHFNLVTERSRNIRRA